MSLTPNQKHAVDDLLFEKMTLKEKRDHNREQVRELKELLEGCPEENLFKLKQSIDAGLLLIDKQTRAIRNLSIRRIAQKVDSNYDTVLYYEKSSHMRNKPKPSKEQNLYYAESADLSVYLSNNA